MRATRKSSGYADGLFAFGDVEENIYLRARFCVLAGVRLNVCGGSDEVSLLALLFMCV